MPASPTARYACLLSNGRYTVMTRDAGSVNGASAVTRWRDDPTAD